MARTIEWLSAKFTRVASAASPGSFRTDDGSENSVAAIKIYDRTGGAGVIIEGTPDELLTIGKQVIHAAQQNIAATEHDPSLRALYGRV